MQRAGSRRLARARDEYAARYGSPLERDDVGAAPSTRRWAVSTRVALIAALAVALVAGVVVVRSTAVLVPDVGHAVDLPEVTGAPAATGAAVTSEPVPTTGTGSDGAQPAPTHVTGRVVVHVVGQVARPGIVELPEGSRVTDALTAAGGPSSSADLAGLNLARVLVDGEQVAVIAAGEAATAVPAGPGPGGGAASPAGPLDLNTADAAALDELPGIGPVLAGRIVAWREEHGRFRSLDELADVEGIGPALLERLTPMVRV
ncbi:ComEA family DNA-binding protein [Cellulomonas cellasea]|uniref:Competence protein ComEA n=1 Tax=Cellulomonas cellasea TaxID=43670 RepID=A0A7W4UC57_9CELL|nr:ComEA family DNA-binding protein [Cellulomonas cellasea]MBB2921377.1 competence protein ComEA [Cellulomonas cellasea]